MAELIAHVSTVLSGEDAAVRAVQFFSNEKWRVTSQSSRAVTFQGMPPVPILMLILTFIGFCFFIVPGVILYFMAVRKLRRFQNLVVTVNPTTTGCAVVISHPPYAKKLVDHFIEGLPKAAAASA